MKHKKHHLLISGTGRAGTTALTTFLHDLGVRTTIGGIDKNSKAGWETTLTPDAPYLIKSPFLCDTLDVCVNDNDVIIDGLIIPIRDLYSAAESRRSVQTKSGSDNKPVPGGLWNANMAPGDQENILATKLYNLIYKATQLNITPIFIDFDRLIRDGEYLWECLIPFLPVNINKKRFIDLHKTHFKPDFSGKFFDVHLITRFNLRMFDSTDTRYKDKKWLENRIKIFNICTQSIKNQTDQDFKWVVLFDIETPKWVLEHVNEWSKYKNFVPLFTDLEAMRVGDITDKKILSLYEQETSLNTAKSIFTIWHDSDDIIHRDVIQEFRSAAIKFQLKDGEGLYFGTGIHLHVDDLDYTDEIDYFSYDYINDPSNKTSLYKPGKQTTCLGIKSSRKKFTTVFRHAHNDWRLHTKIYEVNKLPRFGKILHDDAVVNKPRFKNKIYRTNLINWIIHMKKFNSYLEIGLGDCANFENIVCKTKTGIDIIEKKCDNTLKISSDDFFNYNKDKFDIVFIDGDHTCTQFKKDVFNSLDILNDGGVIIAHDINPWCEEVQTPEFKEGAWTGDIWKVWAGLRKEMTLNLFTINAESGIGIIQKQTNQRPLQIDLPDNAGWEFFNLHRIDLLNLKPQMWFELIVQNDFFVYKEDYVNKLRTLIKNHGKEPSYIGLGVIEMFDIKHRAPEIIEKYNVEKLQNETKMVIA